MCVALRKPWKGWECLRLCLGHIKGCGTGYNWLTHEHKRVEQRPKCKPPELCGCASHPVYVPWKGRFNIDWREILPLWHLPRQNEVSWYETAGTVCEAKSLLGKLFLPLLKSWVAKHVDVSRFKRVIKNKNTLLLGDAGFVRDTD